MVPLAYGPQMQVSAVAVAQATNALAPASKPITHALPPHVVLHAVLAPFAIVMVIPPVGEIEPVTPNVLGMVTAPAAVTVTGVAVAPILTFVAFVAPMARSAAVDRSTPPFARIAPVAVVAPVMASVLGTVTAPAGVTITGVAVAPILIAVALVAPTARAAAVERSTPPFA